MKLLALTLAGMLLLGNAPVNYSEKDLDCITRIVYNESNGQPDKGRQAVALVVINRSKKSEESFCETAHKPGQFDRRAFTRTIPVNKYNETRDTILPVIIGDIIDFTRGAISFHNIHVTPHWPSLVRVFTIGQQVFYRSR